MTDTRIFALPHLLFVQEANHSLYALARLRREHSSLDALGL